MTRMSTRIGFVMDPLESLKIAKDSTYAMMLAAQQLGWEIHVIYQPDLYTDNDRAFAFTRTTRLVEQDTAARSQDDWFVITSEQDTNLAELDVIMMRKDPPFDMEYINSTYILELAELAGTMIVNRPGSLRDFNEKMFITRFPQCCTPFMVSRDMARLRAFVEQRKRDADQDVILKPLDGMGGTSIFRVSPDDHNLSVIIEDVSRQGTRMVMAQQFIPEITEGDKRVLLIDGDEVPYALARIPASGETRGNLAASGTGVGVPLTNRDRWICEQIRPVLKKEGILFAGIDIIGDYLTEINITSPTCIRELDRQYQLDIAGDLMRTIGQRLASG